MTDHITIFNVLPPDVIADVVPILPSEGDQLIASPTITGTGDAVSGGDRRWPAVRADAVCVCRLSLAAVAADADIESEADSNDSLRRRLESDQVAEVPISSPTPLATPSLPFYYRIYSPVELHHSGWKLTHAPLLRVVLARRQHWHQTDDRRLQHYSNHNGSRIQNQFTTRQPIIGKIFLARLTRGLDFHPPTLVIKNGKISPGNVTMAELISPRTREGTEKWFLKPDIGHSGEGIKIYQSLSHAIRDRPSYRRGAHVLQKGIAPLLLYHERKFEFRVWILAIWRNRQFQYYYYGDSIMRLCSVPYHEAQLDPVTNITASHLHHQPEQYKTDILSRQEWSSEVFPQAVTHCETLLQRLKPSITAATPQERGFEIMGFDFLVLTDRTPVMVEINRCIGYHTYPPGVNSPEVVALNYRMMEDLVTHVIEPLAADHAPAPGGGWSDFEN